MEHEHDWSWRYFAVIDKEQSWRPTAYGVRTCECGAIELVQADYGRTPQQTMNEAEADARDEARKAKQREYNERRKALKVQS